MESLAKAFEALGVALRAIDPVTRYRMRQIEMREELEAHRRAQRWTHYTEAEYCRLFPDKVPNE